VDTSPVGVGVRGTYVSVNGALLRLKPRQVLTISDRESRARSLQMAVCVVQIALSERTYSLSLLASPEG